MRATSQALVFTSLYYYADLANGAQYRPAANVVAMFQNEQGLVDANIIFTQFWDGSGWVAGISTTPYENTNTIMTNTSRYVQISNISGVAKKISLTGYSWA